MAIYRINEYIPSAIEQIEKCEICNDKGEVDRNFRSQVSSFGASVQTGSLVAAVAFYSRQTDRTKTDRRKLMDAIRNIVYKGETDTLLTLVAKDGGVRKEEIIDAAVAIKLALNAYILVKDKGNKDKQKKSDSGEERQDVDNE